ncbi:MAG TPA: redoxin family protein, partial [Candidatus Methylacidiphilales bacterium]|nr:redoxin family protein [Candidatus Methylacidiphilales bacterium]
VAKWNIENAAYLRTPGQPEAMLQLVQAVLAAESGDMKGFETSIKEAIWLNPEEAEFYSQFIMSYRRKARMAAVTLPMNDKIATYDGKTVTLAELMKDKKALLIGFWATFSPPSVAGMSELADIEKQQLAAQGVACVGINIDPSAEIAVSVRNERKLTMPWLVDGPGRPIYTSVGHTSFPMAILVTPEGKLLYIGDPLQDDIALKDALEKIGVKYKLPTDDLPAEP